MVSFPNLHSVNHMEPIDFGGLWPIRSPKGEAIRDPGHCLQDAEDPLLRCLLAIKESGKAADAFGMQRGRTKTWTQGELMEMTIRRSGKLSYGTPEFPRKEC